MATLFRRKRNEKENKKIYIRIFRLLATNNSSAIDADWNSTRCCVRMGWMKRNKPWTKEYKVEYNKQYHLKNISSTPS